MLSCLVTLATEKYAHNSAITGPSKIVERPLFISHQIILNIGYAKAHSVELESPALSILYS